MKGENYMSYKTKLSSLESKYQMKLGSAKIFALNCWAEKEAKGEAVPNIKGLLKGWTKDEIEAAEDYYREAYDIYEKHFIIRTIILWVVGVGAVILIKKLIVGAYVSGYVSGVGGTLDAICTAADEAKEDGKDSFDLMHYRDNGSDDDWTYLSVHIDDKPLESAGDVVTQVTEE